MRSTIGEAEPLDGARLATDLEKRRSSASPIYRAETRRGSLGDLPVPRYDLVEPSFRVPCTYEATRGCPVQVLLLHSLRPALALSDDVPTAQVVRDLQFDPLTRGVTIRRSSSSSSTTTWAPTGSTSQSSARRSPRSSAGSAPRRRSTPSRRESARMMRRAGFQVVYIGLESLSQESLKTASKKHNRVSEYKRRIGLPARQRRARDEHLSRRSRR